VTAGDGLGVIVISGAGLATILAAVLYGVRRRRQNSEHK